MSNRFHTNQVHGDFMFDSNGAGAGRPWEPPTPGETLRYERKEAFRVAVCDVLGLERVHSGHWWAHDWWEDPTGRVKLDPNRGVGSLTLEVRPEGKPWHRVIGTVTFVHYQDQVGTRPFGALRVPILEDRIRLEVSGNLPVDVVTAAHAAVAGLLIPPITTTVAALVQGER